MTQELNTNFDAVSAFAAEKLYDGSLEPLANFLGIVPESLRATLAAIADDADVSPAPVPVDGDEIAMWNRLRFFNQLFHALTDVQ